MGVFGSAMAAVTSVTALATTAMNLVHMANNDTVKDGIAVVKQKLGVETVGNYAKNLPTSENIKGLTGGFNVDNYDDKIIETLTDNGNKAALVYNTLAEYYGLDTDSPKEMPPELKIMMETGKFALGDPARVGYLMAEHVDFGKAVISLCDKLTDANGKLDDETIKAAIEDTNIKDRSAFIKAYSVEGEEESVQESAEKDNSRVRDAEAILQSIDMGPDGAEADYQDA